MNISRARPLSSGYMNWRKAAFLSGLLALLAILSLLLGALAWQFFGSQRSVGTASQASAARPVADSAIVNSEQLVGQDNNERLAGQALPTPMATPLPTEALIPAKPIIYPASGDDNLTGSNLRPTWTATPCRSTIGETGHSTA
jgi:hypothetical protein